VSFKSLQRTQELVAQAQEGDTSALDQLCGVYTERVRRIVRFRMGPELRSHLESMDLVQEALVEAVLDLDQFRYSSDGDFLRWLCRIVENTIRDHMDKAHAAKRDIRKQVPLDCVAMDQLKPEYRDVIIFAKIEGLSLKETAEKLNKTPAAVAMLLSRAIVAVTNLLEKT